MHQQHGGIGNLGNVQGGIFIAITESGECIIQAAGTLGKESADAVATKMVLFASRLRNAAREPGNPLLLN